MNKELYLQPNKWKQAALKIIVPSKKKFINGPLKKKRRFNKSLRIRALKIGRKFITFISRMVAQGLLLRLNLRTKRCPTIRLSLSNANSTVSLSISQKLLN